MIAPPAQGLDGAATPLMGVREVLADAPGEQTLREVGVGRAVALALLYEDDEINMPHHRPGRRRRPGLLRDLHPGYVLRPEDRVVVAAATRAGLAVLLGHSPAPSRPGT
ncbi:hypothetical protein [Streptomyces sp. NPDC056527]|uniref:hypothetical protein n=1 Tax=Streptomyces sp. NPDC056527 TaxID=3345853 RepID=UPI0036CC2DD5